MGVLGHWAGRGMRKWCLEVAGARPGGLVATWLCGQTELHWGGGAPRTPPGARVHGGLLDHEREDRRL